MHELEIECPADLVIDDLRVNIAGLELGDTLHVSDLELPTGVVAVTPAVTAVVGCRRPKGETEEGAETAEAVDAEAAPAQPEVISEKKREEREKEKDDD
jgi:large subunit ribosomal protein L25